MTFDPSKMMLWGIDTIKTFMESAGWRELYKPAVETIKPNLIKIFQETSKHGITILSPSDVHFGDKEHAEAETELDVNGGPFKIHAKAGTEDAEHIPGTILDNDVVFIPTDLHIREDILKHMLCGIKQIIIEKQAISAHYSKDNLGGNPILDRILNIFDPQDNFACGVYTEYCVKNNMMPLLMKKKNVWIIKDAIAAFNVNPDDGEDALIELANMGARFITTNEYINLLNNNFGPFNG